MRAAFITEHGDAGSIRIGELPTPVRGPTDALVAVEWSAVNPVDTFVRSGAWATPVPFPFVVGRDLVGTVVDAAPVTGFAPGDAVWCNSLGHDGRQGACAELAVVPTDRLYRLPSDVDHVATVAALHPGATAALALHHRAPVRAGDTIVIAGAAGNVGTCAVRIAREAGARVIATARAEDHDRCRDAGADHVLDFTDPELWRAIRDLAPGGVQLHWDTSGHAPLADVASVMAPGGRVLISAGRRPHELSMWPFYTNDVALIGFVISRATAAELRTVADVLNRHFAAGDFGLTVHAELPLEATADAHAMVESGVRGRVVIRL